MAKFYSRGKGIWFPHIVDDEKKEVYFRIESGFPSTMAVTPIMKEHFPSAVSYTHLTLPTIGEV